MQILCIIILLFAYVRLNMLVEIEAKKVKNCLTFKIIFFLSRSERQFTRKSCHQGRNLTEETI